MVHTIEAYQKIPTTIDKAWEFMSSPKNLKIICPDYMDFTITSKESEIQSMFPGQIITYTLKPLLKIPISWCTEITHVKDKEYFVDEQRFGPYALWHHKHFLKPIENGVEMYDLVHYKLPMGILGKLANQVFVKKQLQAIFDYRYKKIESLFGTY
ncbi:MAG: SRPBCC family protein [Bacteroidetes bacterium]|nr:SRPBCC family protein [Bacteroidota bacterium]